MKNLILAVLAALCSVSAQADYAAQKGQEAVILYENQPCPQVIAALVPSQYRSRMRAAVGKIGDKVYQACWLEGPETVLLQWEDGDVSEIPKHVFRKLKET